MVRIIDVPIEPIEKRYSKQWAQWFLAAFERNHMQYVRVYGNVDLRSEPTADKFLDPSVTTLWKSKQLSQIMEFIQYNEGLKVVFLHDGWFPGIEHLQYLRDMGDRNDIRICAFWHAGSYDESDLLAQKGCGRWARGCEQAWFGITDLIFVGTRYHKHLIMDNYPVPDDKIKVVGLPMADDMGEPHQEREPIIVWPHRLSPEKCPHQFDQLASLMKKETKASSPYGALKFVKTMEATSNKKDYYNLLARSAVSVSTALQETFGIAMVESAMLGCYPVVPNIKAYQETMEPEWRYGSFPEAVALTEKALKESKKGPYVYPYKEQYLQKKVTNVICRHIKKEFL